jgi:hypothetical protein
LQEPIVRSLVLIGRENVGADGKEIRIAIDEAEGQHGFGGRGRTLALWGMAEIRCKFLKGEAKGEFPEKD